MVNPDEWSGPLATARSGDPDAADRMVSLLLQWTHRKLHACTRPDKDDLCASFVEHIVRDQFAYLAAVEPCRLAGYLGQSLRHFIINWRAREDHRQSWEILWVDRAKGEEEDEEDANMDDLLGNAPDPETLVLLRAELDALRDEVSRLTPLNQRIFALLFDEGLSEREVSLQLRMKASTVRWHVHAIRQHLKKWRQAREE